MIKFIYQYDETSPEVSIKILDPDVDLTEVLTQFESFLKASGYAFSGSVDIIDDEEKYES